MDARIVRRVAFVRLLLQEANTLFERANETMAGLPLLSAQDAVEMLLRAVAEANDVSLPGNVAFAQLISKIDDQFKQQNLSKVIPRRIAINGLNAARNNFKHQGILPTLKDVKDFLFQARSFCEEVCLLYFDRSLESFSLADLIANDEARNFIKNAEEKFGNTPPDHSLVFSNLSCAFAIIFGTAGSCGRIRLGHGRSWQAHSILSAHGTRDATSEISGQFGEVEKDFDHVFEVLNQLESKMRIFSLGISAVELDRFNSLVPMCKVLANDRLTGPTSTQNHNEASLAEDVRFAMDFCVQSILLAEGRRHDHRI